MDILPSKVGTGTGPGSGSQNSTKIVVRTPIPPEFINISGFIGSPGIQGKIGVQGVSGTGSESGVNGNTGNQGLQGLQGVQGVQGEGDQGPIAYIGYASTAGNQGSQGAQGAQGSQSSTIDGFVGLQGLTNGAQGAQGAQGDGLQGAQGNQSASGTQGLQGGQGLSTPGLNGPISRAGRQGSQGIIGIAPSGFKGSQGSQAPSPGTIGVQGAQGIQGRYGYVGTPGRQGIQGLQGLINDPDNFMVFYDDFLGDAVSSLYLTSGTIALVSGGADGIVKLTASASSTSYIARGKSSAIATFGLIDVADSTSKANTEFTVNLAILGASISGIKVIVGLVNTISAQEEGALFIATDGINSGKWQVYNKSTASSTSASLATSPKFTDGATFVFQELKIVRTVSGFSFYIDGVLATSLTGTVTSNQLYPIIYIKNQTSSSTKSCYSDFMLVKGKR